MTERQSFQFLVALGGNLQLSTVSVAETILSAADKLSEAGNRVVRMSRLYATPSFPPGSGPDYVNAAAVVEGERFAGAMLQRLHAVEAHFGRDRRHRWGARVLDLDLLAMEDAVVPDLATQDHWRNLALAEQRRWAPEQLILPHPRLQDRAFVLVPLAEVAPDWVHPRLGLTVRDMLARLPVSEIDGIRVIE